MNIFREFWTGRLWQSDEVLFPDLQHPSISHRSVAQKVRMMKLGFPYFGAPFQGKGSQSQPVVFHWCLNVNKTKVKKEKKVCIYILANDVFLQLDSLVEESINQFSSGLYFCRFQRDFLHSETSSPCDFPEKSFRATQRAEVNRRMPGTMKWPSRKKASGCQRLYL